MLSSGVDLMALPLNRFLNVVYLRYMGTAKDEAQRGLMEMQLTAPLPDETLADTAADDAAFFKQIEAQANDGKSARNA